MRSNLEPALPSSDWNRCMCALCNPKFNSNITISIIFIIVISTFCYCCNVKCPSIRRIQTLCNKQNIIYTLSSTGGAPFISTFYTCQQGHTPLVTGTLLDEPVFLMIVQSCRHLPWGPAKQRTVIPVTRGKRDPARWPSLIWSFTTWL